MAEYTQTTRMESPSADPLRQGKTDVYYVYMDDRMRSFIITLPLEEDSADRVAADLKAKVEGAAAGGAKKIEF